MLNMKYNLWCPIRYIAIHSGASLNKINRNKNMKNTGKSCRKLMILGDLFKIFQGHEKKYFEIN